MDATSKIKICPYCAEEILVNAKKCKHCQSMLEAKSGIVGKYSGDKIFFAAVWIASFLGSLFLISLVVTICDYLLFGDLANGENAFNFLTSLVMLYVSGVVAQKTAKKFVRKETVAFLGWLHPNLSNQKQCAATARLSAIASATQSLTGIMLLILLPAAQQGTGSMLLLVLFQAVAYGLCCFFTIKMSRIAAIVALVLYSIDRLIVLFTFANYKLGIISSIQYNQVNSANWLVTILFFIFLVNGVRAVLSKQEAAHS